MPRISVVVACIGKNVDFVDMAVRSCLRQKHLREVIVVLDDVSQEILRELGQIASEFPLVKLIPLEGGYGAGAARNFGAKKAAGEFLCFLEPDDELLSDYFEQVIPLLDSHPEFSSIKVGVQFLDPQGSPLILPDDVRYQALMSSCAGNLILRRKRFDCLGGFSEDSRFIGQLAGEEGAFSRAVEQFLSPVGYMPEAFYRRNVRVGSPILQFLTNTRVIGPGVFEFVYTTSEHQVHGLLGQAIDDYLDGVGARIRNSSQLTQ